MKIKNSKWWSAAGAVLTAAVIGLQAVGKISDPTVVAIGTVLGALGLWAAPSPVLRRNDAPSSEKGEQKQ